MKGGTSLLACLCGGSEQSFPSQPERKPSPQTVQGVRPTLEEDDVHVQNQRREAVEALALLQLQRELGTLQGNWLARARGVLSSIAAFVGASDVRFYGATRADTEGPVTSFILLATAMDGVASAAPPGGLLPPCCSPSPGDQVWPASAGPRAGGSLPEAHIQDMLPSVYNQPASTWQLQTDLLPPMLDRMLADQAPVTQSVPSGAVLRANSQRFSRSSAVKAAAIPSGSDDIVVALVPLTIGDCIAGALYVARSADSAAKARQTPQAPRPPIPPSAAAASSGGATGGAASSPGGRAEMPTAAASVPCPSLLTSPQALQQLGLSVSMCLLGTDVPYLRALCDSLRQLAASTSMQQLVGGLCDAVAHRVRQRFLLDPRVIAALVPEPASAVGLLFSWGSADRAPVVTPSVGSRPHSKLTHATTSMTPGYMGVGSSDSFREAAEGGAQGTRVAGPVAALVSKEEAAFVGHAHSDTAPHNVRRHVGGVLSDRDGQRPAKLTPSPRVLALTQTDVAAIDTTGATASGALVPLRVRPFPLAQTLLRHLIRKASAFTGAAGPPGGTRAHAVEVEDCAVHVQDPKKPSRDVLLLLTNTGATGNLSATPNDRMGSPGSGILGSPGGNSGSFTLGRRGVCSLVLLVLPAGDGKGMLGLYVTFPQQLPQQLLREARSNLLEIVEVASSIITRKLTNELSMELETLATAAPGSYVVVEGPEDHECTASPASVLVGCELPLRPTDSKVVIPEDVAERLVPMFSPLAPPFLYDSHGGCAGGSEIIAGCNVGSGGVAQMRSMNLMDTAASPHGMAENTAAMASLMSGRYSALAGSNYPALATGGDCYSRSTNVIHMEELDQAHNTLRAQMPLLVASMQNSISNARADAAVAAAAAAASYNRGGKTCTASSHNFSSVTADQSDLAQLELHSQLGHGGCAVVFKGTMGTLDCAIKLMEMPDVDDVDEADSTVKVAIDADQPSEDGDSTDNDQPDGRLVGKQLAARRALLRNAMELAAMTSISHPNIMQVYSTFSNITLGRRAQPDGTERFFLRPLDHTETDAADAPPICVAIVCEWCDKGCLGSALQKRTFPTMVPVSDKRSLHLPSVAAKPSHVLEFKGILMTLLEVAMALRHLHANNVIHRDLKPDNVLLKTNTMDPRGFTAKLADFGFVTLLNQPGDEGSGGEPFAFMDETCGTVTHMAPESWLKPARLDASSDVYSFGILMWELTACGTRPYPEVQPHNIARGVRRGLRPIFEDTVPVQYRSLSQRCWAADPGDRPRSSELVAAIGQLLSRM